MSSAAFLFAPARKESIHGRPFDDATGRLLGHRGGYRRVGKAPKRGGEEAWLSNRGGLHDFNFGEFRDEIQVLAELARDYGGDYLAVWTYGKAIHTLLVRSAQVGEEPTLHETSLRLDPPPGGRDDRIEELAGWFAGSAFRPDLDTLRAEHAARRLSVTSWFAAFGITGAREISSAETAGLWDVFDEAAGLLLRGETAPQNLLRALNKEIAAVGKRLRSKPWKTPGRTARLVAGAVSNLEEMIGKAEGDLWKERARSAAFYWDITDCDDAGRRLTAGVDAKGLGAAASLGRLLGHYPVELMRDNLFHALAGLQAEGANGHAYVESFLCLAEHAHAAGFTLAVFPQERQQSFRERFGISAFDEEGGRFSRDGLGAEAFVDIPGVLKAEAAPLVAAWFEKERADGWSIRAEADGTVRVARFESGKPVDGGAEVDEAALARAARRLEPRAVFAALGLPDLLEPGEWTEGAYAGESCSARDDNEEMVEPLKSPPRPRAIRSAHDVLGDFGSVIGNDEKKPSFRVVFGARNDEYQRDLMNDLSGRGCVEEYGQVWVEENGVAGYSRTHIPKACFVRLLGDLPPGARLVVHGQEGTRHYVIDPAAEPSPLACADLCYGWNYEEEFAQGLDEAEDQEWASEVRELMAEQAFDKFLDKGLEDWSIIRGEVFKKDDRPYWEVDISGFELEHAARLRDMAASLSKLGMRPLGDLVCSSFRNVVMRGFAGEGGTAFGTIMIPVYGDPILEFYSTFEDGSSLTTTTQPGFDMPPEKKIHHQRLEPGATVEQLWARHSRAVDGRAEDGKAPVVVEATLAGLAAAVQEFLERQLGALAGSI